MIIDETLETDYNLTRQKNRMKARIRGSKERGLTENLLTQTCSLTGSHAECTKATVGIRRWGWRRGWCVTPKARRRTPPAQNSVSRWQMVGPQAITTRYPTEKR